MDLEKKAIERIQIASEMSLHHYGEPLVCTYSGGKDSDVMLELFKRAGVPFEVSHGLTTVDAPPTVRHIKDAYIRAFDRMLEAIHAAGKPTRWKNGYDVFLWWMEDQNVEGQISLEDYMNTL